MKIQFETITTSNTKCNWSIDTNKTNVTIRYSWTVISICLNLNKPSFIDFMDALKRLLFDRLSDSVKKSYYVFRLKAAFYQTATNDIVLRHRYNKHKILLSIQPEELDPFMTAMSKVQDYIS